MSNPSAVIPNHLSTKIPIPLSLSLSLCFVECDDSRNERSSKRRASNRTPRCLFLPGDRRSFLFPLLFLFHAETRGGSDATSEGGGGRRKALERWQLWTRFRSARRLIVEVMVTRRLMKADRRDSKLFSSHWILSVYRYAIYYHFIIFILLFSRLLFKSKSIQILYIYIYIYIFVRRSVWKIYIWYTYTIYCYAISIEKRRKIWYSLASLSRKKRESVLLRGVKVHV